MLDQAKPSFAVRDAEGVHTLADVRKLASDYERCLHENDVRPGDRVVVRLGRTFRDVAAIFGVSAAGAIVVPVGAETPDDRVDQISENCSARYQLTTVPTTSLVRHDGPGPAAAEDPATLARTALMIYTSGSSGIPKGVVCSHSAVLSAVDGIQQRLAYRDTDRVALLLPMAFDYGLYQAFLALRSGAQLVIYPPDSGGLGLGGQLDEDGITVLPSLPALTQSLVTWCRRRNRSLRSLRLLTSTGADFTERLAQAARRALPSARVVPMYGLTECKRATIHTGSPDEPHNSGTPIPGCRVVILDEDREPVADGEVGEIVVVGDNVMSGYWPLTDESLNSRFGTNGDGERWVASGDRGRLDAAGSLYVLGRVDDLFKHNGYRTSVTEIEEVISTIEGVERVCVRPPDDVNTFLAYYEGAIEATQLRTELGRRLESYKIPEELHRTDQMPINSNGKIDRQAVSARFQRQVEAA
ncbi:AMP-binding protein [Actinoplanes philippinensis]|uniref:AMP-binding protein n=1 Tax=Actinoplanes philippinensis TaxID=35752 RepID=UPI00340440BA